MTSSPHARFALLPLLVASSATGCLFVTDFGIEDGGAGGTVASSSVTSSSSSDVSSSSTGGCTPTPGDPENCGACGWACGPDSACTDGVCSPVQTAAISLATTLAVFDPTPDQQPPDVFSARHSLVGTATIERWAGVFGANAAPAGTLDVPDDGIGRLFASQSADFPSELLYAPQLATCSAGGAPCVDHCTNQPTCGRVHLDHPGSMGTHVNGAVLHGPLTAYTTDTDKRVYVASTSCIGMVPSACTPRTIVDGMLAADRNPSASHYVGVLSREPIDGMLWWTTVDDQNVDACLYRAPMPGTLPASDCTNCEASCAVSSAAIPNMWGVTTSELGVFVGTKIPPSVFPDGPIFVVDRTTLTAAPLFHTTARFPAAADDRLLYAFDAGTSPGRLVALDLRSSVVVASATLPSQSEGGIFAVDASSRDWVYFTSQQHLFRWRKPPLP